MSTRCRTCRSVLTGEQVRDWGVFCCEICWDSEDAETQREIEAGRFDHLWKGVAP